MFNLFGGIFLMCTFFYSAYGCSTFGDEGVCSTVPGQSSVDRRQDDQAAQKELVKRRIIDACNAIVDNKITCKHVVDYLSVFSESNAKIIMEIYDYCIVESDKPIPNSFGLYTDRGIRKFIRSVTVSNSQRFVLDTSIRANFLSAVFDQNFAKKVIECIDVFLGCDLIKANADALKSVVSNEPLGLNDLTSCLMSVFSLEYLSFMREQVHPSSSALLSELTSWYNKDQHERVSVRMRITEIVRSECFLLNQLVKGGTQFDGNRLGFSQQMHNTAIDLAGIPFENRGNSFESFEPGTVQEREILRIVKEFADCPVGKGTKGSRLCYLFGPAGTGKTHLSYAVEQASKSKGLSVFRLNVTPQNNLSSLLRKMKDREYPNDTLIQLLNAHDVVVIDDFFMPILDKFSDKLCIKQLITRMHERGDRKVIITSNTNYQDFLDQLLISYGTHDEDHQHTASRFNAMLTVVDFKSVETKRRGE